MYDVTVTSNAVDALKLLQECPDYDAVLCNVIMPETSGIDLFRALTRKQLEYAARVIFMTGGAFLPKMEAFLESVDQPVLRNPFKTDKLLQVREDFIQAAN